MVSLKEWIGRLEGYDRTDVDELVSKPALKLLDLVSEFEAGNDDLVFERGGGG